MRVEILAAASFKHIAHRHLFVLYEAIKTLVEDMVFHLIPAALCTTMTYAKESNLNFSWCLSKDTSS